MNDLHKEYQVSGHPDRDFRKGRIFRMAHAENAGSRRSDIVDRDPNPPRGIVRGNFQQNLFHSIKIFVVILPGPNYCVCWMVASHGEHGVGGPGAIKNEHLIIHGGETAPHPLPRELATSGKEGLLSTTIRVELKSGETLTESSRLNVGKPYTIENNWRIKSIGRIHDNSMNDFDALIEKWLNPSRRSRESGLRSLSLSGGSSQSALVSALNTSSLAPFPAAQIYKIVSGAGNIEEEFDSDYQRRPPEFFTVGKVFTLLTYRMSDPSGSDTHSAVTDQFAGYSVNGEVILQDMLWLVVVKCEDSGPLCLRILSYRGQGVPQGFVKQNHSIVYSGKDCPESAEWERASRDDLTSMRPAIRIHRQNRGLTLTREHRLRYNTVYKINLDVVACEFGDVDPRSLWRMRQYMNELGMPLGQGGHEDIEPAHTETQNRVLRLSTPSADYDEPTTSPKTRHEQNLQVLERQEVANFEPEFTNGEKVSVMHRNKATGRPDIRTVRINTSRLAQNLGKWEYQLINRDNDGWFADGTWFRGSHLMSWEIKTGRESAFARD